ncbi:MAG: LamG domain-containing protein, partial [Bacteroidota bacterium]
ALDFDGVNDVVNIVPYPVFNNSTLTIEAWIKTTDNSLEKDIVGYGASGSGSQAAEFRIANGKLQFGMNASNWQSVLGVTSVNSGNWTHVAVVKNGNAVSLFVNGKLDASGILTSSAPAIGKLQIGGLFLKGVQDLHYCFPGTIDEVRIWHAVRTETQIRENMMRTLDGNETGLKAYYRMDQQDGSTLYDITSNGYNGTLTNMAPATDWVASDAFNTWIGGESSIWSDVANWSNGALSSPQSAGLYKWTLANVTTFEAAISGDPTINNLLISSTSAPALGSGITVNSNLLLEKNMNLNGQTVTLGASGYLLEGGAVFSGTTGMITTTRPLSNISAQNVAGLGAVITTGSDMGSTTINRKHGASTIAGQDGILRYYDINPATNTGLNATLIFNYLDGELNSNTEANLNLYKTTDAGATWTREKGTVSTSNNTLTLSGIGSFSGWTASSSPKTIYVNDNASGKNDGTDWTDAYSSLQSALDNAVSSDQIWVAAGTYTPTSAYDLTNTSRYYHFRMIDGVAIYGGFAGTETDVTQRTNFGAGQTNETILSGDLLNNDNFDYANGGYQGTTGDDNCYHVIFNINSISPVLTNTAILDGFTIKGGNGTS